ncbi:arsenate reductase (glutaredoxin) [Hydrogenophaga crassostreae]|uniref:Arsenate reductase n=1 Tax=Hydrogenophaga crassostreae TaxID=1763535 RepID=A0A167HJZ5_9BURK|nr:arsenate reductase (glutaredoxin) [Hydrogenophaga crassostreae]AOW15374.1 arsenate reductase (glutaredoxin) [Hydrogenophaga crassostreae]OAD41330.1 arsenate reductase (glutaredoxin) [Hydrogenophaga crassostreae]
MSGKSTLTLHHNPKCSTSRNLLALVQSRGADPLVVEYLKTPLDAEELQALLKKLGMPVRDLLRQKGTPYDELGLGKAHWTDEQLIAKMAEHPILMNRPVVVTALGARICRPAETVLEILPKA